MSFGLRWTTIVHQAETHKRICSKSKSEFPSYQALQWRWNCLVSITSIYHIVLRLVVELPICWAVIKSDVNRQDLFTLIISNLSHFLSDFEKTDVGFDDWD